VPGTAWDFTVTMPSHKFQSVIKSIASVERHATCTIRVTGDVIFFTTRGDLSRFTKLFRYNQDVVLRGEPMMEDMHFLALFIDIFVGKTTCIVPTVSISLEKESPLPLNYVIEETTEMGELEQVGNMNILWPRNQQTARLIQRHSR